MPMLPMQGMMPFQGVPMQGMMPMQAGPTQVADDPHEDTNNEDEQESASDSDSEIDGHAEKRKYNKGADGKISKASTKLVAVPRTRLAECLEKLDNRLDVTFTADFTHTSLLQLMWLLTRMKPETPITTFRSKTWKQLFMVMGKANTRIRGRLGEEKYNEVLEKLLQADTEEVSAILTLTVEDLGWDLSWCRTKGGRKRTQSQPSLQPNQRTLDEIMHGVMPMMPSSNVSPGDAVPNAVKHLLMSRHGNSLLASWSRNQDTADTQIAWMQSLVRPQMPQQAAPPSASTPPAAARSATTTSTPVDPAVQPRRRLLLRQPTPRTPPEPAGAALAATAPSSVAAAAAAAATAPARTAPASAAIAAEATSIAATTSAPAIASREQDSLTRHFCVFCQGHDDKSDAWEALLCGHVFHTECLNDYCEATGKSKQAACPHKCSQSDTLPELVSEDQPENPPADAESTNPDSIPDGALAAEQGAEDLFDC